MDLYPKSELPEVIYVHESEQLKDERKLWIDVYTMALENGNKPSRARDYADQAVDQFRERFSPEKEDQDGN